MSETLDSRLRWLIQPSQRRDGSISVQYSIPVLTEEGDPILVCGPTAEFENSHVAFEALKRGANPPITQQIFDEATREGDTLWIDEKPKDNEPQFSTAMTNIPKPVYFRMLSEDPGSCNGLSPSEPAEEVPNKPGVYSIRSTTQAERFFGPLRDVLDRGKTAKLRLHSGTSAGSKYLCTIVATHNANGCTSGSVQNHTNNRKVDLNLWKPPVTSADTASV